MTREVVERAVLDLLHSIADDPYREGLAKTPHRVANFYSSWITHGDVPPFSLTTFAAEQGDGVVLVRNIPFYSLCEHHLLPFFGRAHVAYLPNERIIGLSKIPRIVKFFASRPQNQERLTSEIATCLESVTVPHGVAIQLTARHLCTEMRGVCSVGNETVSTLFRGRFRSSPELRHEFTSAAVGSST